MGNDPRLRAIELLGRWTRLAQGHLPLGRGCSCGAGLVNLRIADMERDLLDYLRSRHPGLAQAGSIADLLRALAGSKNGAREKVLTDLERSLDSFDGLHR